MRTTILLLLTAILGTAFGIGFAIWQFNALPEQASLESGLIPANVDQTKPLPTVEVDDNEFDFGVMDAHAEGRHAFLLRNVGDAPLTLREGRTTCKCTLSDVEDNEIPPGGEGTVTLTWSGKTFVGPYAQTAMILTNDPKTPAVKLKIHGEMTSPARATPGQLVFSSVTAGQAATGEVLLFGYLDEPLEITDLSTDLSIDRPEHIEVSFSPLSDDEVKEEKYATCGQRMTVTIKPGLPLGPFRGRIRLATNVKDLAEIVVLVEGKISSDISVLGPGWHSDSATLRVGTFDSNKPVKRTLLLKVGGLRPEEVAFETTEVSPEFVQVRFGERTSPPGSSVAVTPIEIEIPAGSPPCAFLGPDRKELGCIRLKTTHATVKEMVIYFRFLIEG